MSKPSLPSLRIAVYAIAKNEAKFVERFCDSARAADLISIADTGSSDGTIALAQRAGAVVHSIAISPFRFDLARNASLALLPSDIDICFALDLDEVLLPGWREEIESRWTPTASRLGYFFSLENGVIFRQEKVHARHGYSWHHPCHENLWPYGMEEIWVESPKVLAQHLPDTSKPRSLYLPLLALGVHEDSTSPRNSFYYTRELYFHNRWSEALAEGQRFLSLPKLMHSHERSYILRLLSRCAAAQEAWGEAISFARQSVIEAPSLREPWCEVAIVAYKMAQWPECLGAALGALSISSQPKFHTADPAAFGALPASLASIAAWHLGFRKGEGEKEATLVQSRVLNGEGNLHA